MSGISREDDLRGTIPFEEIELLEMETTADLFAALPENPPITLEPTVARLPHTLAQEKATRAQSNWDLTPPLAALHARKRQPQPKPQPQRHRRPEPPPPPAVERVYDEITAVREAPEKEESPWLDLHAVVDSEGRLRLPENVAKQLREGAIVEVRLASWAAPEGA